MKFLPYILKHLRRNWVRTTSTILGMAVAFAFHVTPLILLWGLAFATIMGLVGGLLPAFRAARRPITMALREA